MCKVQLDVFHIVTWRTVYTSWARYFAGFTITAEEEEEVVSTKDSIGRLTEDMFEDQDKKTWTMGCQT
jgi:hypothetical protein